MNNSEFKWLMAGLAGALFSLVAILATTVLVAWYFPHFFVDGGSVGVRDREDGPEIAALWAGYEANYRDEQQRLDARIAELGLSDRYKTIQLHDDTLVKLYVDRDFAAVESRLNAQLDACKTPLDFHRYSLHIEQLSAYTSAQHPPERLQVLNDWVAQRPESHHARLIRGGFGHDYWWAFHGYPISDASKSAGWVDPEEQLRQARADLLASAEMNPKDPEPFSRLIKVDAITRTAQAELDSHFKRVLEVAPYHFDAHQAWIHYGQPSYGGTWALADRRAAESAAKGGQFPLLATLKGYAKNQRSGEFSYHDEHLAATEALLEQYPGDLHLMGDAARHAVHSERLDRAAHWFTLLGEVYPDGSAFGDVVEFHEARLMALGEH